jgi:chemotaxis protein histidine kinase CheA
LLSLLRDGKLALSEQVTSGLLAMVDVVRCRVSEIQATEHDGENDYPELRDQLKQLQGGGNAKPAPTAVAVGAGMSAAILPNAAEPAVPSPAATSIRILDAGPVSPAPPPEEPAVPSSPANNASQAPIAGKAVGSQDDVLAAPQSQEARGRESGVETVRVGVNLLDKLMNLVGELVLARNQLLQFSNTAEDAGFHTVSQRMNLIATELQEDVMKTRMQPIGNIRNKFPRTVRDLAHSCGKEVRLEMVGQDTELDRTIIEAIKDPLTLLVRNSMDHGIETPEARRRAGKDATGVLTLRAFHEGGQVNIEISDDGAGLNTDRIRKKAVERGLTSSEQAGRMPDRDIFNLSFLPGFSTAEKITNVSGRGVGMDVVKTNVEKFGGTVDVQSIAGKGTPVRVKIPLTLAIIPDLIVRCSGDRFAIPQISLTELVRLESGKGIETVHGAPVYRLRGQLLPLVYLSQTLKAHPTEQDGSSQIVSRGELMDFAGAREKHHQWLSRLKGVLAGKTTMTVEEAGSHRECALGKWLYGVGLKDYGAIQEMQILEQAHKAFHTTVREVVAAKAKHDDAHSNEMFAQAAPQSQKVIDLLISVEKAAVELQNVNIVVLQAEGQPFGLVVDDILDTEEIVVKPLGKQLKGISAYSGATIMGDGRIALILDVLGLAQRTQVIAEARDSARDERHGGVVKMGSNQEHALLLAENGLEGRVAIPLSLVARLEEFPRTVIEHSGTQEVMQYRGQIIPLVRLSQVIPQASDAEMLANAGSIQVVVYAEGKRTVGLIVDRIVDIVEEHAAIESLAPRAGVVGSLFLHDTLVQNKPRGNAYWFQMGIPISLGK